MLLVISHDSTGFVRILRGSAGGEPRYVEYHGQQRRRNDGMFSRFRRMFSSSC